MKLLSPFTKLFSVIVVCFMFFVGCKKEEGSNNVPNEPQFLYYNLTGAPNNDPPHNFTYPTDSLQSSVFSNSKIQLSAYSPSNSTNYTSLIFFRNNISVGSSQVLDTMWGPSFPFAYTRPNPIIVNITEYGTVGQFVAGNFSGTLIGPAPPNRVYNLSGSFQYKRNQ